MTTRTVRPVASLVVLAVVLDLVAVLVFAAIGRGSHAEGVTVPGVLEVAAPFLLGALAGWLLGRVWRAPTRLGLGAAVWGGAAVIGLALRVAVTHRLPVSFVLVASVSLAVLLLGWRLAALLVTHLTHRSGSSA